MTHILFSLPTAILLSGLFLAIFYSVRKSKGLNGFDIRFKFRSLHYYRDDVRWEPHEEEDIFRNEYPKKGEIVLFFFSAVLGLSIAYLALGITQNLNQFKLLIIIFSILISFLQGFVYEYTFYHFNKWISRHYSFFDYELFYLLFVVMLVYLIGSISFVFSGNNVESFIPTAPQLIFILGFILVFILLRLQALILVVREKIFFDTHSLANTNFNYLFRSVGSSIREKIIYIDSNKVVDNSISVFISYPKKWFFPDIDKTFRERMNYLILRPTATDFSIQEILSASIHYGYDSRRSLTNKDLLCMFPYFEDHKDIELLVSTVISIGLKRFSLPIDLRKKLKDLKFDQDNSFPNFYLSKVAY